MSTTSGTPFNDGPSLLGQPRVIPGVGPAAHSDSRHDWGYEKPLNDPAIAEIWCYTPRISYRSGEVVDFHVHSSTRPTFEIEITRDGPNPERVFFQSGIAASAAPTPDRAHVVGCDWPVAFQLTIDPAWREQLLNGWDDLQVTRARAEAIEAFKLLDAAARPWARL